MQLDAFKTNGNSPPKRYRLKVATWTVVREPGAPALPHRLSKPEAAAEIARQWFQAHDDDREHLVAFLLDSQNGLHLIHEVSIGTQQASLVHPREVFGPALREGAASIVLAHNHPSGDVTPSREDVRLTRQLVEAGKLLDIAVHDHILVGNGSWDYTSFANRGLL